MRLTAFLFGETVWDLWGGGLCYGFAAQVLPPQVVHGGDKIVCACKLTFRQHGLFHPIFLVIGGKIVCACACHKLLLSPPQTFTASPSHPLHRHSLSTASVRLDPNIVD